MIGGVVLGGVVLGRVMVLRPLYQGHADHQADQREPLVHRELLMKHRHRKKRGSEDLELIGNLLGGERTSVKKVLMKLSGSS